MTDLMIAAALIAVAFFGLRALFSRGYDKKAMQKDTQDYLGDYNRDKEPRQFP